MKFLECSHTKKKLIDIKLFLRNKGVFVYTTEDFLNEGDSVDNTGIWIVFDEQYLDAYKLLRNSRHKVSNPFSLDQMKIFEKDSKEIFFKSSQSFFERTFAIILSIFLFGFILFVIYHVV